MGEDVNLIKSYKEKGLSVEATKSINMIIGCIMASQLDNQEKRNLINFMRSLEEYIEEEQEG